MAPYSLLHKLDYFIKFRKTVQKIFDLKRGGNEQSKRRVLF